MQHTWVIALIFLSQLINAQADMKMNLLSMPLVEEITPVKIRILTGNLNGRLHLTQKFPNGILVNEQNSSGGIFSFSEQTLEIHWLQVNSNDSLLIEYSMFITPDCNSSVSISSTIAGSESGIEKEIQFNDFKFTIQNSRKTESESTIDQPKTDVEKKQSAQSAKLADSPTPPPAKRVEFAIQLGAFKSEIDMLKLAQSTSIPVGDIWQNKHKGLFKYYYGHFKSKDEAAAWIKAHTGLIDKAFIVAFIDNQRVELEEAIEKLKEGQE